MGSEGKEFYSLGQKIQNCEKLQSSILQLCQQTRGQVIWSLLRLPDLCPAKKAINITSLGFQGQPKKRGNRR